MEHLKSAYKRPPVQRSTLLNFLVLFQSTDVWMRGSSLNWSWIKVDGPWRSNWTVGESEPSWYKIVDSSKGKTERSKVVKLDGLMKRKCTADKDETRRSQGLNWTDLLRIRFIRTVDFGSRSSSFGSTFHLRATVHFKDRPLSYLWTVYFGPHSLKVFWTVHFDRRPSILTRGRSLWPKTVFFRPDSSNHLCSIFGNMFPIYEFCYQSKFTVSNLRILFPI